MDLKDEGWSVYYLKIEVNRTKLFILAIYIKQSAGQEMVLHIEYCRNDSDKLRANEVTDEMVLDFVNNEKNYMEEKMGTKWKELHPFVIFNSEDDGLIRIKKPSCS